MVRRGFAALALSALLADSAWPASVEVWPFGEQDGRTVYALALAGDIKSGDDLRVASLLGKALVEDRFPGFMVLRQMVATQTRHSALRALRMTMACRFSSGPNASAAVRSLP